VERPELATVSASWVAHVGSANERPGITGLAHLFEHMMFKGSTTIGTTDIERDLEIMREQEALQETIREFYEDSREKWRRGEVENPYDPENRTDEIKEIEKKFQALVDEQRSLMIKDEFSNIYTNGGASFINAFTNSDVTVYIATVPANKIELWYWMEAERLLNPVFREFYSERDVVYEERRLRTESTPTGVFDEQLNSMFWQSHPYGWPVVGWPSDLRVISKEQADDFFDTYYAPNNLTAVLVGNIDVEQAKKLAERYFGRLERGKKEPPDVVTLEMEQLAEKRLNAECDCPAQIQIQYHSVPFGHRDDYVFDVLGGILNGQTGRLYKAMVEGSEIASQASAGQDSQKYAGSFSFSAETKGDHTPAELEAAWGAVLAELRETPVPQEELDKVKNIVTADVYRRLENPLFLSMQLALYDGMGHPDYLNTLAKNTAAVTSADIQRVVKQYLTDENRLVGSYTRKAGSQAEEIPEELTGLPSEVRQQVMAQAKQIASIDDPATLEQALGQMEAQAAQVPPEMKPALDYMKRIIEQRLAELSGN
jgi:predicted Zn-dependent peptidase